MLRMVEAHLMVAERVHVLQKHTERTIEIIKNRRDYAGSDDGRPLRIDFQE